MKKVLIIGVLLIISGVVFYYQSLEKYKYVKTERTLPAGKIDNFSPEELEIENILQKTSQIPECREYFKQFFSAVYLIVDGFDNLCFTFNSQTGVVERGIDKTVKPDVVININKNNCENLYEIFKDKIVTDEEEYRIFRVTILPSITSTTQIEELYNPFIAKKINLPNFIQLKLTNENKYIYQNTTDELMISILNVDGQWLVFKGAMGDPDVRMEFSHKKAKEFRKLVFKLTKEKNADKKQKIENLKNLKMFIDEITTYRRK